MDKELDSGQGTGYWTSNWIMDKELDHGQGNG